VDEKEEDRSEDSFQKHLVFYKKLDKKISEIQNEILISEGTKILKHLNERIDAIELDQTRIRKMFPKVDDETWKGLD
jgi:uncharacterized protein YicC (UPF0701 family)